MFPSVEYLHSIICICLLPRYVRSEVSWPFEFVMYPIALIRSGLWWFGLCCGGRIYSGMVCGWFAVFGLSSCSPSSSGCRICGSCGAGSSVISCGSVVKSLVGVFPRSRPIIGHLPPFMVCRSLWSSRKVMLCRLILSLDVDLHPPRMCVLLSGEWHFEHVSVGPCFLLHMCTCTPQATSSESRRAL